ncbi:hypothetical protein [Mycolicibacterium grossiae]|uniref:Uncharacterized protein n=1 Tax=Mycolicibacterium grossiae TaxID=1552759 RepID=A0A1E8Q6A8_9MYCO|nr:hypothetical protein [Mycolicibacterium grossiae]OFJ53589.1 hypothetical protein BEL07_11855 [Mycolicibacterium grossiae]QEM46175.1 hypothetical protein FZ046_16650 [Mycolicibacterium grossiae]
MKGDILYSPETSALLLAMTAVQCARGVPPREALDRAHDLWRAHDGTSWEFAELAALVDELGTA